MTLTAEKNNGTCRLLIEGEMTIFNALEIKKKLVESLSDSAGLELDLSQVAEFDTTGFQLLVMIKREAGVLKKEFKLDACSPPVLSVLELYNMKDYFA